VTLEWRHSGIKEVAACLSVVGRTNTRGAGGHANCNRRRCRVAQPVLPQHASSVNYLNHRSVHATLNIAMLYLIYHDAGVVATGHMAAFISRHGRARTPSPRLWIMRHLSYHIQAPRTCGSLAYWLHSLHAHHTCHIHTCLPLDRCHHYGAGGGFDMTAAP